MKMICSSFDPQEQTFILRLTLSPESGPPISGLEMRDTCTRSGAERIFPPSEYDLYMENHWSEIRILERNICFFGTQVPFFPLS